MRSLLICCGSLNLVLIAVFYFFETIAFIAIVSDFLIDLKQFVLQILFLLLEPVFVLVSRIAIVILNLLSWFEVILSGLQNLFNLRVLGSDLLLSMTGNIVLPLCILSLVIVYYVNSIC